MRTIYRIRDIPHAKQLRLFLIPFLFGTFLLTLLPAAATVAVAFTEYNAVRPPVWTGLQNLWELLDSPLVSISIKNSLIFLGLAVPLRLIGALGLALLLNKSRRGASLYRAAIYVPTIIPEAAYALIWLWIFNPLYGPLNNVLSWLHLPAPAWLLEPATARYGIVLMALFQIGEGFVILLAGLQTVPRLVYDAARVDGANAWQRFWLITFPLLLPWMLLLTFRDLLVSLQNTFTPSFIMTYGGPYYATTFIPLLVYELAFDFFDFGLAAALLLVTYLLIGACVIGLINFIGLHGGQDALAD